MIPRKLAFPLVCLTLLLFSTALYANSLRDGMVAYWPLDANNSGTSPDVAFTNTLSVVGNPTVAAGQRGNAFTFTASPVTYLTNTHAADSSSSGLPIYRSGGTYSIAFWVKGTNTTPATPRYIFSEGGNGANPLFILQTGNAAANNNKLDAVLRNDGNTTLINHRVSTTTVFDNAWHHIVWVDDRGAVKLYIDGNLDATDFSYTPSGTYTLFWTSLGTLVRTTAIATGNIFNGQIDDVALWERALSSDEANFVRTNGIPTPVNAQPPGLYTIPTSVVKRTGDWHRFSVTAIGSRPYTNAYQWNKNGSPIPSATDRTLFISTAEVAALNPGDFYSVTVTNDVGATNSPNVTITLVPDGAPALTNGLVDYWPLDTIVQSDTNLLSPELHFGHNMVLRNFASTNDFVSGQFSNALTFDAVAKYTTRSNGTAIYNTNGYSVAMWVRADFSFQTDRRIFSEGSSLSDTPLFTLGTDLNGTNSSLRVIVRNNANVAPINGRLSTRAVFDNTWHHVVWTDTNGQAKVYVDGTLDETDFSYSAGNALTLNQTALGAVVRAAVGNYYFGDIDEVATWNRVLSWTEIQGLITNGVPVPAGVTPPAITSNPVDLTNNIYVSDDISFSATASGSEPLAYQWLQNGVPISPALNPSAATSTLLLTNVQIGLSNATFSMVVTNGANSVTSSIARLFVLPWTALTNGEVLKVDVGRTPNTNPDPVQPGFSDFPVSFTSVPSASGIFSNAVKVTFSGIGANALQSRDRVVDSVGLGFITNSPPFLTQAQLYNDFVFQNSNTGTNGMRMLLEHLAANTPYGVMIWSYDIGSTGDRISDWAETSSGTPIVVTNGYTFNGSAIPTNNYQNVIGGLFTSSATGKLQFEGLRNSATTGLSVFVNAVRLVARPTGTRIARAEMANGIIRLTVESDYPGQPVSIVQNSVLVGGTWVDAVGGTVVKSF